MQKEIHELAKLIPEMAADEYAELVKDIASNGLIEPITLYEGKILDGRHRYRACMELGLRPEYEQFQGGDALQFVISKNVQRRHLDETQRGIVAGKLENMKQSPGINQYKEEVDANLHRPPMARKEAAKMLNVSPRTVATIKAVEREAPELIPQMEAGTLTAHAAYKEVQKRQRAEMHAEKRTRPLPNNKYHVIYADPPWQYNNSGFNEAADNQYPTMPIEEIRALPINDLTTDVSILFLWATNPLLIEALSVLKAWGFEYKTNIAWVKDRGRGKGWYLKSKHELLLIGVKSNTPHPKERPDSCVEADRGITHSKKPEVFYDIIESMYEGNKIELFAREAHDGWEAWGNEPDI